MFMSVFLLYFFTGIGCRCHVFHGVGTTQVNSSWYLKIFRTTTTGWNEHQMQQHFSYTQSDRQSPANPPTKQPQTTSLNCKKLMLSNNQMLPNVSKLKDP